MKVGKGKPCAYNLHFENPVPLCRRVSFNLGYNRKTRRVSKNMSHRFPWRPFRV
jgi:hypothetical protein